MSSNLRTKRICMLAMSTYPDDPRIRREAEALINAGIEVDIICMRGDSQKSKEIIHGVSIYRIIKYAQQEKILKYAIQSIFFIIISFFWLQKLNIKRKYRVIQAHNLPDYLIFVGIWQKFFGAKLVLDIHDPSVELFEEKWPNNRHKFFLKLLTTIEKYSFKIADHIITVTETCKNNFIKRGSSANKITLVLNTADENIFKFHKNREFKVISDKATILYHGTIANRFGLHNAVKAIKIVQKYVPGTILNLYGGYEESYRMKLEQIISELEIKEFVNLHGSVKMEDIPGLIAKHDFGIVPYLNTKFMNLALSTKAFEYIMCGIPVIATRLDELSNTLNDKCITYVDDSKPEGFAEAIRSLCADPLKRKLQTEIAFQSIQQISGNVMKKRYVDLINQAFI